MLLGRFNWCGVGSIYIVCLFRCHTQCLSIIITVDSRNCFNRHFSLCLIKLYSFTWLSSIYTKKKFYWKCACVFMVLLYVCPVVYICLLCDMFHFCFIYIVGTYKLFLTDILYICTDYFFLSPTHRLILFREPGVYVFA